MIIFTYLFQHLVTPFLLKKRSIAILVLVNIAALALIYGLKNDTYDLVSYTKAMDYPLIFEIGYAGLTLAIRAIIHDNRAALAVVQLILAGLFCVPGFLMTRRRKERAAYFIIVFLSVAFTLGVNNAIRQAFAALLVVLSLLFFFKGRPVFGLLFMVLSVLFHNSGVAFFAYALVAYLSARILFFRKDDSFKAKLSPPLFIGFLMVFGFLTYFSLSIILQLGYYHDLGQLNMSVAGSSRTDSVTKTVLVATVYLVSELAFGSYDNKESYYLDFRILRTAFILLLVGLATKRDYTELSARVMYFYFVIELMLMIAAFSQGKRRGVALILGSYAFAFNAINILSGSA